MKLFLENTDASLSRDDILNAVWGQDYTGEVKTVDVHMRRLRNKIEDDPSHPGWIHTVWGHGYKWSSQHEEH
jgi:DNA-binding response OmpR family regulator